MVAEVISEIASFGIEQLKQTEASLEDKMMFGPETSLMSRLFEKGNRNLIGVSHSDVVETLVNVLAENQKS